MHKITINDILRKLTSRKLWAAVAAFVAGIMAYRGADAGSVEAIGSLIMMGATVVAYIVGEGLIDSAAARNGEIEAIVLQDDLIGPSDIDK